MFMPYTWDKKYTNTLKFMPVLQNDNLFLANFEKYI